MTLKEMIDKLRVPCFIKIRDSENMAICDTFSDSRGVNPYQNLEVIEWFVYEVGDMNNTICVLLNIGDEE